MIRSIPALLGACSLASLMFLSACNTTTNTSSTITGPSALEQAISARSADAIARDSHRHPAQTLEFFDVNPGMTVAEALPGGGWYTNILANYLGSEGALYGLNYPDKLWSMFGFFSEEMIAKRIASTATFPQLVAGFTNNGVKAQGFTFETVPEEINGTVDRVLLIRALHNLNRFEPNTGVRSQALTAVHSLLKDDGLVGVVQHRAPADAEESGADGSRGYLKQAMVVELFEEAGFKLVASSEINANPKDKPSESDSVWRLPPSYNGSKDDPAKKAAMTAIGESDRMTLLFRKK
ncbi:MAG: class I SAM-dependent methyltransferase [Halioglobus sp.]